MEDTFCRKTIYDGRRFFMKNPFGGKQPLMEDFDKRQHLEDKY